MDKAAELTKIQQISSMVQEEVRIFSNTIAMAKLGRLNPDQISTEALSGILDLVRMATQAQKLVSPVQVTGDIFAMPMSYIYNRADKVFYFIVHIPLVRAKACRHSGSLSIISGEGKYVQIARSNLYKIFLSNNGQINSGWLDK